MTRSRQCWRRCQPRRPGNMCSLQDGRGGYLGVSASGWGQGCSCPACVAILERLLNCQKRAGVLGAAADCHAPLVGVTPDACDAAKQGSAAHRCPGKLCRRGTAGRWRRRRQGCRSQQGSLQARRRSQQRGSAFGRRILSVRALLLPLQLTPAACCASQLHSPVQDVPSGLTWPACRADLQAGSTIVGGKTGISSASNAGTPQREAVCCNPRRGEGTAQPATEPAHAPCTERTCRSQDQLQKARQRSFMSGFKCIHPAPPSISTSTAPRSMQRRCL